MKPAHEKYIPFVPLKMTRRAWPDRELKAPPVWCSVDLRDGNQALIDPMNVREKLELFHTLVDIGVKEIEVGFPSAWYRPESTSSAAPSRPSTAPST